MLVKVELENWMCFKERIEFSMCATSEQYQKETLVRFGCKSRPLKVLPIASIYGSNAAGKSTFVKALAFIQLMVCSIRPKDADVPLQSCKDLPPETPSLFSITFVAENRIYELSFACTRYEILQERLARYTERGKLERVLYSRNRSNVIVFEKSSKIFSIIERALNPNALFLQVADQLGAPEVLEPAGWFRDSLRILYPESKWQLFDRFLVDTPCTMKTKEILKQFGTGITDFQVEDVEYSAIPLQDFEREQINIMLKQKQYLRMTLGKEGYILRRSPENPTEILAQKMVFVHGSQSYQMRDESDGTLRLLDLTPALFQLETYPCVFVIDELDRSLHPLLCKGIVQEFLSGASAVRQSQLIFTTHNLLMLQDRVLRRDESWIMDSSCDGKRELYPFSDFKECRSDRDILKSYLAGRLGGIPMDCR